jgi:hypothetical protein
MDHPMHDADSPAASPAVTWDGALRELIMGFRATQLISVAAKLGLADQLREGPQTPERLAELVHAEPRALYRLLRALASLGVFAERSDGAFVLTPMAQALRTDAPGSLRSLAILYGEEWLWQAYGGMLHSVQTGEPAFTRAHGQPFYAYLEQHPTAAAHFQDAMSGYSGLEGAAILEAYDFSDATSVVDVGGGEGALMSVLLQGYPQLSGVVFDLAPVVAGARRLLTAAGVAARARTVAGDFLAAVPRGGDIYVLKSVLHNWDDAAAERILRTCRRAMAGTARLLVVERVIPPGNAPAEAKLFDINMLVVVGGQERTEPEYRALFRRAGFDLTRIIPTRSPMSVLEGLPVGA